MTIWLIYHGSSWPCPIAHPFPAGTGTPRIDRSKATKCGVACCWVRVDACRPFDTQVWVEFDCFELVQSLCFPYSDRCVRCACTCFLFSWRVTCRLYIYINLYILWTRVRWGAKGLYALLVLHELVYGVHHGKVGPPLPAAAQQLHASGPRSTSTYGVIRRVYLVELQLAETFRIWILSKIFLTMNQNHFMILFGW